MAQTYTKGSNAAIHRIDLPLEKTGFRPPPCQVQLKLLPQFAGGWTALVNARSGATADLAGWLGGHPGFGGVALGPGLAPKLVRATVAQLPPAWATVAALANVHHLDLGPEGHATWFVEAPAKSILSLVRRLEATVPHPRPGDVRCRPVRQPGANVTRRQHEALAMAVALGYYEIPHRVDLRSLARRSGFSLGSVSELLRRAEAAILCAHVDSFQLEATTVPAEGGEPWRGLANLARPGTTIPHHRPPRSLRNALGEPLDLAAPDRFGPDAVKAAETGPIGPPQRTH